VVRDGEGDVVTRSAVLQQVRQLLVRVEDRLQGLDPDGPGMLPVPAVAGRLDGAAALIRVAEALLKVERDETARLEGKEPRSIAVGVRFWSEGLGAVCRVIAIDGYTLEFESESTTEPNIRTDVPLDLAARHFASGRWQLAGP
jgi:hypothetical protein